MPKEKPSSPNAKAPKIPRTRAKVPAGPLQRSRRRKMQGTQALAAAFPFNANKPGEIGDAARTPKAGATAEPAEPAVTGSTLTRDERLGQDRRAGAARA